jgi:hypothetical protein
MVISSHLFTFETILLHEIEREFGVLTHLKGYDERESTNKSQSDKVVEIIKDNGKY